MDFFLVVGLLLATAVCTSHGQSNGSLARATESEYCYWDLREPCYLDCMSGKMADINRVVGTLWKDRLECHTDGLKLKLGSSISFSVDWTVPPRWFTATAKVVQLIIESSNIAFLDDDALVADAFSTIEKLTFNFAWSGNMLTPQSLNGLAKLKTLRFDNASLGQIRRGTLNAVADTLEELFFLESSKYDTLLLVDGLTGGNKMERLKRVKIQRNMKNAITKHTFAGLVNVETLDLSYCQIEFIAAGSFDLISSTILVLKLGNNKLARLPVGLFDRLVTNPAITLHLNDNQWECDCDLCYLRWLIKHGQAAGLSNLLCRLPIQFRNQEVIEADYCRDISCEEYVITEPNMTTELPETFPSTSMPSMPPTMSTSSTNITPPSDDGTDEELYKHQCNNVDARNGSTGNDFVIMPSHKYRMKFLLTENATLAVLIESPICNMFLIWFNSSREMENKPMLSGPQAYGCSILSDTLNQSTNFQQLIVIDNLRNNVPYVFCLMERNSVTVSPLNCMPYMNMVTDPFDDGNVWLWEEDKPMQIAFVVVTLFCSVMGGFLIAYLLLRRQTRQLEEKAAMMGYRSQGASFDASIESTDCSKRTMSIFERDNQHHNAPRRGSEGSVSSAQSYALAVNLSRFDIVQMQLEKKRPENQYYLENMPYAAAPAPPAEPEETNIDFNPPLFENIYSVIEADPVYTKP